jgi:hypothetical protein
MKSKSTINSNWSAKPGVWFSIVAILSLLWNIVGAMQFVNSITATEASMSGAMMSPEQISVITALPSWVTFVFGVGVVTSLVGSVLMYLRHRFAMATLSVSFLAFALLTIAYSIYGVFEALGTQQLGIMITVVVIAAILAFLSRKIASK